MNQWMNATASQGIFQTLPYIRLFSRVSNTPKMYTLNLHCPDLASEQFLSGISAQLGYIVLFMLDMLEKYKSKIIQYRINKTMGKINSEITYDATSITDLRLNPVFDHLHNGLHDLGVLRLVDKSDQHATDEHLAHVGRHRTDAVLHQIQAEDQQLAGNVAEIRRRRSEMLASHPLKNAHEGRYQAVDVRRIVHASRLQDHQSAEQLRRRIGRHPVTNAHPYLSYLLT